MDVDTLIELKLVHEIHTSERKSFRACRRRWDWIFRENLYPVMTAKPLEFGTAFHLGMETYYNPDSWKFPRDVMATYAIQKFVEKCEKQRQAFLEQQNVSYIEEDVQKDYNERVELGKGMLKYYFDEIAPKEDIGWTPVKVEIGFMVPIPHPDTKDYLWCKCDQCWKKWMDHPVRTRREDEMMYLDDTDLRSLDRSTWQGLPVVYAGRCDMLAVDNEGMYWIFDWKSARAINVDHDEFLELDDQVLSYVWALRKCGINVRGFVYHEQKKGYPQPPRKNVQRRKGCMFSVAKNQDTDYDTYLKTIQEEDNDAFIAGYYDDFLEWLEREGPIYFKRWQIHKSDYQCERAEYDIGQEALEMIDPNLRIYPSPGRFGCSFCAFRQPCLEVNSGGDYQYALDTLYERREAYYVRTEPSTESKGGE